jgi:hypothetical protein
MSGLAVALVAAALGDPLVESIGNAGLFGIRSRDDSHQSVLPALIFGLLLAAIVLVLRVTHTFRNSDVRSRYWGREFLSGLKRVSVFRNLAPIFATQLAFVCAMEWCEHALGYAGPVHGLSWLAGPIACSLALHLATCGVSLYAFHRLSEGLLRRVITAMCDVLDRILVALSRADLRSELGRSRELFTLGFQLFAARRVRGRAPPILPAHG